MALTVHQTYVESVAPSGSVITIADVKEWLGVGVSDETQDDIIDSLILSAVNEYQQLNHSQLLTATYLLKLDCWPSAATGSDRVIEIREHLPVTAVSSITYVDTSGNTQTFSSGNYTVDTDSTPCRIELVDTASWPSLYDQINPITVTYTCGYGAAADIPDDIKQTIRLIVQREFDGEYTSTQHAAIRHQMKIRGNRGLYG